MISLRDLLPQSDIAPAHADRAVAGVTSDSRAVRPGWVFFAIPGAKTDGMAFAEQACAHGALAVVTQQNDATLAGDTALARVADARAALSQAAARFFPRQPATVVAVTGTSGKTSTASFTRQIWARLGRQAAMLGTTGVVTPSGETYGTLTTPDPVSLHETLDRLAGEGVTHLAMEASSHGLDQRRLDGVRLSAGAFTNLSRDHLDYHPDLDAYLAAKLRLFDELLAPDHPAVVDVDTAEGPRVAALCAATGRRVLTVGANGRDIRITRIETRAGSSELSVAFEGRTFDVDLPVAGAFMASNALVAAGLCLATGGEPAAVFAALEHLVGAPGRLEKIGERRGAPVFVDYAHKPDALEKVLSALRPLAKRKLAVVFGCGGDRDPGKRRIMGEIAARLADVVIVTDDNPRSEAPAAIRAAILDGAPGAREIGDRAQAIREAISELESGDALVIAGKGHETGQIVGAAVLPFSDHAAARAALAEFAS